MGDHAEFISSVLDPRDHPYVLGATKPVQSFVAAINAGKESDKDYLAVKKDWKMSAVLMTFDEAVKASATEEQYRSYIAKVADKVVALSQRRTIASSITGKDIFFDWELPRTPHGQYMFQWSTQQVVNRAVLAAPFGDVTWSRQDKPNKTDMHDFHMGVRAVHPDRLFAFGFMGAYDFANGGYSPDELRSFHSDIARDYGIVWQVQPIWATQGLSLHARQFAKAFAEEGMAGYMRDVAKPAIESMPTDKHGKPTARGGYLADAFFDVVAGREITSRK
ncbi:hypothetical protein SLS60_005725 [Paraconiothyrium brasiliense]|uniref:methylisocitrate lyase n=1 Tax=Paraconiothyrium brasiliense TaxID=300254 RepID=A0ABR3RIG4_9PLEO